MEFLDPFQPIDKHGRDLPHWQQPLAMQFVTFRLGDAMPQEKLRRWEQERQDWLSRHAGAWSPEKEREYQRRFPWRLERWLDQGWGTCLLRDPSARKVVEAVLMCEQGQRVTHHAWVIMPNHVHLLFTPGMPLENLVKAWKGATARQLGRGSIWQPGYRDTMVRHWEHFANAVRYIRRNPAKLRAGEFTLWQGERALAVR